MEKTFFDKYFKWLMLALCTIGTALYLLLCQGDLVWMDEAYTLGMIRRSFSDIWKITALDVHPPLYYFLLKVFAMPFGNEILAGKLFSAVFTVITMVFGGVQLKKLFNAKTGVIFAFLFTFFPFLVTYGVEIRMYALGGFFVFANAIYGYKAYINNSKKDWILFTVSGLCAAYTHYFALVSAGVIYGLLFVSVIAKKRELIKPWIICAIITVVGYIPWLQNFIVQLQYKIDNEYWIDPITFKTVISYFREMFGIDGEGYTTIAMLTAFVIMLIGVSKSGKNKGMAVLMSVLVPVLTLAVGLLASFLVRPVFVVRYLLPSAPVLIAGCAIGLSEINKKTVSVVLAIIVIIGGCINYGYAYVDKNTHYENRFDTAFYERNNDCEAYVVYIDRNDISPGHTETVLAFYETEKPIYQVIENYGYYPFPNFRFLGDFDIEKYNSIKLLLAEGKEIPEELLARYNAEYNETATSLWIMADVYTLTRK